MPFLSGRSVASRRSVLSIISSIFFTSLLWLAGSAGVQDAAAQSTVRGVVTDASDGAPMQGANVVLDAGDGALKAAATKSDGFYQIGGLDTGTYIFRVSFVGYETYTDTLTLDDQTRTINVELSPSEQMLDEVTVEARRGAATRDAGQQTVQAADLDRIPTPSASGDVAAYLQSLPGVVSGGDRGGQLYIRGGTPTQNLVLVDGIPILKPFHISGLYSAFPQEIVQSADVYAGGFGAEYMEALSSVIDVKLRAGNTKQYEGGASIGPFLSSARLEGPIDQGKSSFLASIRHSVVESSAEALYGRTVPLEFYDATGRYYIQGDGSQCTVTGMRTYDRGRIDDVSDEVLTWSNTVLGTRCLIFGEQLGQVVDFSLGVSDFHNDVGTAQAPERAAGVRQGHLRVNLENPVSWGTFTYGARATIARYSFELNERFVGADVDNQFHAMLRPYAKVRTTIADRLTLEPSVGINGVPSLELVTLEPRLRMQWKPFGTDRQEVSAAVGRYRQVAEGITDERDAGTIFTAYIPSEFESTIPSAIHGILGFRQRVGAAFEVGVEGYLKDIKDIPVARWTPVARFNTQTTRANGTSYGADVRVEYDADPLYAYVGYGYSSTTYRAASDDLGAWAEGAVQEYNPPHDRRHQVNAVTSYTVRGITTSVAWTFGSGQPFTQVYAFDSVLNLESQSETVQGSYGTPRLLYDRPYGARLPTYHRLDLSVEKSFSLGARTSLDVKGGALNLYNRDNIFYIDIFDIRRVNQTPVFPYLSLQLSVD